INIPPLRDRPQDIPVLAGYFLSKFAAHSGRAVSLSPGAKERIAAHKWPGNVRELFHVLQRVLVMLNSEEDTISGRDIDRSLQSRASAVQQCPEPGGSLEEAEKRSILQSLEAHGWNISRTAAALGIDRRTLQRKISKHLIRKDMQA
ncbi:MAG: sigma-54-dependent Fis family transcriptional regulator, partial [Deltaproteobacteria bacterium]|nr:sigma-54-dependent Fis family transcriptional regulator [Deltaproteobacteria bacterium]